MSKKYIWHINEEGEIEVRDSKKHLMFQTGVDIHQHILKDSKLSGTQSELNVKLQIPSGLTFERYMETNEGRLALQKEAKSLVDSRPSI